tara:strand:- start:1022 stop:1939 length:918 start_codon:yes stop_codon:yes gene_type:complete
MTKARDLANVISGSGTLNANVIPALPASKITSGTLGADRIPDLATTKITSGTFADARLSSSSVTQHVDLTSLSASNLTSGTVPSARLSLSASDVPDLATSKITSGTFADARLSASSVTQHVDLSNLNASNLTSGSIPNARVPSGAVTQHVSAVTQASGTWSPSTNMGAFTSVTATYSRTGNIVTATAHGKWSSRTSSSSTTRFIMSGLPVTSRNQGTSVGSGTANFYNSRGREMLVTVVSNSTQIRFFNHGSPPTSSSYKNTANLYSALEDTNAEGYYITARNMHESSMHGYMNAYWWVHVVYQV